MCHSGAAVRALGWITFGLFGLFTACFAVATIGGWTDEATWEALVAAGGSDASVVGVVILSLVADLGLPVPSSAVMTAAGALLGVVGGTAANLAGSLTAAALGYGLCARFGQGAFGRLVGSDEQKVADWFDRWGVWAILLSRAVPMLTETISCLAGLQGFGFARFILLSAAGTAPVCAVYAYAGSHATAAEGVAVAVAVAFVIPAMGYGILRLIQAR